MKSINYALSEKTNTYSNTNYYDNNKSILKFYYCCNIFYIGKKTFFGMLSFSSLLLYIIFIYIYIVKDTNFLNVNICSTEIKKIENINTIVINNSYNLCDLDKYLYNFTLNTIKHNTIENKTIKNKEDSYIETNLQNITIIIIYILLSTIALTFMLVSIFKNPGILSIHRYNSFSLKNLKLKQSNFNVYENNYYNQVNIKVTNIIKSRDNSKTLNINNTSKENNKSLKKFKLNKQYYLKNTFKIRLIIKGICYNLKYCNTCNIFRSPFTSHCRQCNVCIDRYDHHCPWLGNCIGYNNYSTFFYFLMFIVSNQLYVLTLGIIKYYTIINTTIYYSVESCIFIIFKSNLNFLKILYKFKTKHNILNNLDIIESLYLINLKYCLKEIYIIIIALVLSLLVSFLIFIIFLLYYIIDFDFCNSIDIVSYVLFF